MLGDRLAEGPALLGIGHGQLEGADGHAARAGRDVDAANLDPVHHLIEAATAASRPAEDRAGRQPDAVEHHLGGLDALVAHLVDLAGNGQARPGLAEPGLLLDQERGHVLIGRAAVKLVFHQRRDDTRPGPVRQPHLLAVKDEFTVRGASTGLDGRNVRAAFRLTHRERPADLAGGHLRQQPLLLLFCAVLSDHVRDDEVGIDDPGDGHPAAGNLLDHQGVGQQRFAEAAVLLGDRQAEQAHVLHPRHDRVGEFVGVLERRGVRDDLLVHESPDH